MTTSSAPGRLIGSGRWSDTFDIGGGRVLRRYRDARIEVDTEVRVMRLAKSNGVPVPQVFEASGPDIVMEHVTGPTMLDALITKPWTLRRHAAVLAELHHLVHAVPGPEWLTCPSGEGDTLLHTDLHPGNVILGPSGPVLIDWQGARRGPPGLDEALTWVLITFSQVPGGALDRVVGRLGQRLVAGQYRRALGGIDGVWIGRALAHRLDDPSLLPNEARRLRRRVPERQG
ncbi:MAG TPA: phosphotransferase [Acidimicrobiales bacterium]|nr:phosphotransferase [Acidimicrobiales bacterium]